MACFYKQNKYCKLIHIPNAQFLVLNAEILKNCALLHVCTFATCVNAALSRRPYQNVLQHVHGMYASIYVCMQVYMDIFCLLKISHSLKGYVSRYAINAAHVQFDFKKTLKCFINYFKISHEIYRKCMKRWK